MPRLIDAEALLEKIDEMMSNVSFTSPYQDEINIMLQGMERVRDCLEEATTIDPESLRPHGRWDASGRYRFEEGSIAIRCTECGCALHLGEYLKYNWHYCPNCGAKMDGEEK